VSGRLSTILLTALTTVLASALSAAPTNGAAPNAAGPNAAAPSVAAPRATAPSVTAPSITAPSVTAPSVTAPSAQPAGVDWVANLNQGHAVDVAYANGALRLTAATGLLTLPARPLTQPVGRLSTQLDAVTPPGGTAEVDVRGRLPGGRWTEWLPTRPNVPTTLPGPSTLVQLRVLLTGPATGTARPEVRGLRVHAEVVPGQRVAAPAQAASYRVFATREGLVDGHTANGHKIVKNDLFVALPSWRSLADEDGSEYSVKVCSAGGRCAWAPVWDVGPWNTKDDYWSGHRELWHDLPQGVPEAQAAFRDGHNDGKDGTGRTVGNPAGIDLSDGMFDAALELTDNSEVTVSYLWTGGPALSTVDADDQQTDAGAANSAAGGPTPDSGARAANGTAGSAAGSAAGTANGTANGSAAGTANGIPTDTRTATGAGTSDQTSASTPGDSANNGSANNGSANDDSGKPDSGRTDSGDSGSDHSDSGKTDAGRTEPGGNHDKSDAGHGADALGAEQAVPVRSAPAAGAPTVGVAANDAGVPVECSTANGWLRIGPNQYLPASAVDLADDTAVGPC
jgi:hypothetical protein